jgi:hypothetical protein
MACSSPPACGGRTASAATSPLSFWSVPTQLHHRLALRVGADWLAGFLACITAAARIARDELAGLRRAETAGATLARSQLPRGRSIPCCAPRSSPLAISPQAASSARPPAAPPGAFTTA